jgi:putative phosphoribosyl transferase
MYFSSRLQAGRMLASQLAPRYRYKNCAVIALSDGGVMVGAQIAMQLHCVLTMLLFEMIELPREPIPIAGITSNGNFVYNPGFSSGEVDEMMSEYRGVVEEQKLAKLHKMNEMLTSGALINRKLLKRRTIILVSDGLKDAFTLDMALDFLKPIEIERLIVATPLASVKAIDRVHIIADEVCCLSVVEEYAETDHYYDKHDVPDHQTAITSIKNLILNWQ